MSGQWCAMEGFSILLPRHQCRWAVQPYAIIKKNAVVKARRRGGEKRGAMGGRKKNRLGGGLVGGWWVF